MDDFVKNKLEFSKKQQYLSKYFVGYLFEVKKWQLEPPGIIFVIVVKKFI